MKRTEILVIVSKKAGGYQVQLGGIFLKDCTTLDEAKDFAIQYPLGLKIEIWNKQKLLEEIDKRKISEGAMGS